MGKLLTINQANYKKITIKRVMAILAMIWVIFSILYIIKDQWEDFQLSKMQQSYQNGVSDSVKTLISESAKCNKIPLYNDNQTIEMIEVSCVSDSKKDNSQESANKKSVAPIITEQPQSETIPLPATPQSQAEQPSAAEKP